MLKTKQKIKKKTSKQKIKRKTKRKVFGGQDTNCNDLQNYIDQMNERI